MSTDCISFNFEYYLEEFRKKIHKLKIELNKQIHTQYLLFDVEVETFTY